MKLTIEFPSRFLDVLKRRKALCIIYKVSWKKTPPKHKWREKQNINNTGCEEENTQKMNFLHRMELFHKVYKTAHTHTCPKKTHTYAVVRGKEIKKENLNWATHMGCLSIDRRPNRLHWMDAKRIADIELGTSWK